MPLFNASVLNYFSPMQDSDETDGMGTAKSVADASGRLPCTNDALRRATRQLGILYDEAFAPTGLKATQLGLLWRIESLGGDHGPTLLALARRLDVGVSALTHALRPLVRNGLVSLSADARDKRSKHAALTKTGRDMLNQGIALWADANARVERLLGAPAAATLRAIANEVASDEFAAAFKADRNAADV